MDNCLICKKQLSLPLPFIYEGEHALIIHYHPTDENPKTYKGHLFVETKRHISSYADLNEDEAKELGWLTSLAAKSLKTVLEPEHIYTFTLGHLVDHLHVHVVPRYSGTPEKFWGGRKLGEWEEAPLIDEREIISLSKDLISGLDLGLQSLP